MLLTLSGIIIGKLYRQVSNKLSVFVWSAAEKSYFGAIFREYTKHQIYRTINRSYILDLYTQPSSLRSIKTFNSAEI